MDPLLSISFSSFSSVWYWIFTGLTWSAVCHKTLGVPYDAIVRADMRGGQYADDVDQLTWISVRRINEAYHRFGPLIIAFVCFLLTALATFGFYYRYELAQAIFAIAFPLSIVQFMSVSLALKVEKNQLRGKKLRSVLVRRRFWNQVIGLLSIMVAAVLTFFAISRHAFLFY